LKRNCFDKLIPLKELNVLEDNTRFEICKDVLENFYKELQKELDILIASNIIDYSLLIAVYPKDSVPKKVSYFITTLVPPDKSITP